MQTGEYEKNSEYLTIKIFYYFANFLKSFSSAFQLRKWKLTFTWEWKPCNSFNPWKAQGNLSLQQDLWV